MSAARRWLTSFGFVMVACLDAHAGLASLVLEQVAEAAARTSGRPLLSQSAKRTAMKEVEHLAGKHGDVVLEIVKDGGLEMLEAVTQYGDEVVQIAAKASEQGRRALALDVHGMLPLVREFGVEVLEAEAKAPGQAANLFRVFDAEVGKRVAAEVATVDLPRLIKYAEKADGPTTRRLLLDAYRKEGAHLFTRIPPGRILEGGLTAAMLVGAHRMTAPFIAIAEVLRQHPILAAGVALGTSTLLVLMLLWRFELMPWDRRRGCQAKPEG
ncbi:hypothetical protein [Variovorax sp. LjRoot178]|uniref:hypothetical protein n=1 Tax=Variovorax sp. LjRoot178 TaxID=3342277 RepID=UPI003ED10A68